MGKKNSKKNILIIVIIVISLILVFSFLKQQPKSDNKLKPISLLPLAVVVTSVDEVDIISNVADLDKAFFRISAKVDMGGEGIVGSVTDDKFNEKLRSKGLNAFKTDFDLTFDAKINKEEAIYPIKLGSAPGDTFYLYNIERKTDPGLLRDPLPCSSGPNIVKIFDYDFLGGDRFCVLKVANGRFGDMQIPSIKTDVAFSMQRAGSKFDGTLSNFNDWVEEFRDNNNLLVGRVRITEVSDNAGAKPPNQDIYRTLFLIDAQKWQMNLRQDIDLYKTESAYINNRFRTTEEIRLFVEGRTCTRPGSGAERFNLCTLDRLNELISSVNNAQQKILTNKQQFADGITYFEGSKLDNSGKIRYVPRESKLTNVEILLDVQAKWIGVRSLVSRPLIEILNCNKFKQNGAIKVKVKNDGDVASRFSARLDSCGKIDQIFEALQKDIPSKKTDDFFIPIDSDGTSFKETCTVTAFNVELPQSYNDTRTVECESVTVGVCDDGDQQPTKIEGKNCILECKNGEFQAEPSLCCTGNLDTIIKDGKVRYVCAAGGNITSVLPICKSCDEYAISSVLTSIFGEDTKIGFVRKNMCTDGKPSAGLGLISFSTSVCSISYIKIGLVIIILIIGTLVLFDILESFRGIEDKKFLRWIIAFILSLIIGYVVYKVFIVGIIITLIILFMRNSIKGLIRGFKR